jgi:hypothetical protein
VAFGTSRLEDRAEEPSDGGSTAHGHRTPERDPQSPPGERGAANASRYAPEHEEKAQGRAHYCRC